MARPLRIQYPGAYYHVMNRGNRREDIFITDTDRSRFVDALADSCETFSVKLIAYVLMTNHFHLLVQTAYANLSEFMRHFLLTYTVGSIAAMYVAAMFFRAVLSLCWSKKMNICCR